MIFRTGDITGRIEIHLNPIGLGMARRQWRFGHSKFKKVNFEACENGSLTCMSILNNQINLLSHSLDQDLCLRLLLGLCIACTNSEGFGCFTYMLTPIFAQCGSFFNGKKQKFVLFFVSLYTFYHSVMKN